MGLTFPGIGTRMDLLWENAKTGEFAGQKISLDLTAYDAILVISRLQPSYKQGQATICYKGLYTGVTVIDTSAIVSVRRAEVNDTGVTFGDALDYDTQNVDNNKNWPYRIYGVKF